MKEKGGRRGEEEESFKGEGVGRRKAEGERRGEKGRNGVGAL
jgi:hypothetical protein